MAPQGALCTQSPVADIDTTDPHEVQLKYTPEHDAFDHGGTVTAPGAVYPGLSGCR